MFKIVSSFSRPTSEHEFFCHEFNNHETIKLIGQSFINSPGAIRTEIIKESENIYEIAMVFETEKDFLNYVFANQQLLAERSQLIETWLKRTGHVYKYYIIN